VYQEFGNSFLFAAAFTELSFCMIQILNEGILLTSCINFVDLLMRLRIENLSLKLLDHVQISLL